MKPVAFSLLFSLFSVVISAQVSESAKGVSPVAVNEQAPNPTLRTVEGKTVPLEQLRGTTPTLVVFYRGGWCPYCTRHLSAL